MTKKILKYKVCDENFWHILFVTVADYRTEIMTFLELIMHWLIKICKIIMTAYERKIPRN